MGCSSANSQPVDAFFDGAHARLFDDDGIDAGEFFLVGDQARPGVHGVEHVFFELGGERGQLLHHGLVSRLAFRRQADAREPEILERAFDDAALGGVERARFVGGDGAVGAEQRLALREVGPVVR